jgi:pyruvate dehydrogenase E2 component (dihydrolipoamide acetyltransferase)
MAREVVMPRLSDTMEEGKILKWHKRPGEEVAKGELLAEIETDKANMELEAYDSGVLTKIVVEEGGQAPIGQPIAYIGSRDEVEAAPSVGKPAAAEATPQPSPAQQATVGEPTRPSQRPDEMAARQQGGRLEAPSPSPRVLSIDEAPALPTAVEEETDGRIKASPLARKLAAERGIDLSRIQGSGPGGRILREDVEKAAAAVPEVPAAVAAAPSPVQPREAPEAPVEEVQRVARLEPFTRMQQTIARRMTASKQQVPHFYVTTEVDTGELTELRHRLNAAGEGVKVTYNDLIVKAVALALADMPLLNATFGDDGVRYNAEINIGIAVALERGLVVPVIHHADRKGVRQIARENAAMFQRVRDNKPRPEDFQGATFTISNLGMYDVDEFIAIIDQPAAAILAIGSIGKKPVVVDDAVVVRERMRMTISADHRVVYGAEAAQFLQIVKRRLENPYSLLG